ncbi:MAG: hypothetical protein Kapaf2KO_11390 [Candidatus Kapaibacteriales bacterium]
MILIRGICILFLITGSSLILFNLSILSDIWNWIFNSGAQLDMMKIVPFAIGCVHAFLGGLVLWLTLGKAKPPPLGTEKRERYDQLSKRLENSKSQKAETEEEKRKAFQKDLGRITGKGFGKRK